MTVKDFIRVLQNLPEELQNLPVGFNDNFEYPNGTQVKFSRRTWVDSNYPWNIPDTDYLNIEEI